MNVSGGCLLTGCSAPSCEGALARRLTALKGFAVALLAAVALAAGMPAWAASFPVFNLNGGVQIPDPAPFSVSSDSLNYVAKTVTITNSGTNTINRVQLTISASTKVPVKDFSACVAPCTSVSTTTTSVQYFFDVFPASASVSVVVSFSTPISDGSTPLPTLDVLGAVRINNTSNNSSQLVASLTSPITLGGDPANVLGYLPKTGGQVTALKKGSLKTTVTFPCFDATCSNSIANPIGSVAQEVDPSSCISLYLECLSSTIHLPATGVPLTFTDILKIALELNVASLSKPASTKPTDITILYQKQEWQCMPIGSPTCTFQFVPIGDPLPVQPCNADGSIPSDVSGFASGRCLLPPLDLTTGNGSNKKGVYKYLVNSHDNGTLLMR